ncbi:hypothetical protein V1292_005574 [Bradyrhizobium sp. AZCC 1719]|uniref:hypothetical protein n=1 Tax=Bradyrhizobium sp. AZCC 1719 TaxID=3117028 RepID=UPI002FF0667D
MTRTESLRPIDPSAAGPALDSRHRTIGRLTFQRRNAVTAARRMLAIEQEQRRAVRLSASLPDMERIEKSRLDSPFCSPGVVDA